MTLKWQIWHFFLHPWVPFDGPTPREEHLMMVLFTSYGWHPKYQVVPETWVYPKYRAVPETLGLPEDNN